MVAISSVDIVVLRRYEALRERLRRLRYISNISVSYFSDLFALFVQEALDKYIFLPIYLFFWWQL